MNPRHSEIICLSVQRRENSSWSPSFTGPKGNQPGKGKGTELKEKEGKLVGAPTEENQKAHPE